MSHPTPFELAVLAALEQIGHPSSCGFLSHDEARHRAYDNWEICAEFLAEKADEKVQEQARARRRSWLKIPQCPHCLSTQVVADHNLPNGQAAYRCNNPKCHAATCFTVEDWMASTPTQIKS